MKKFISIMLILSTLLSLTIICNATLIEEELIDIPAEEEILPMASTRCSDPNYKTNYDYYNMGWTMQRVSEEKGWILVYYTDYYEHAKILNKRGVQIGRYDKTSSSNQEPHFHLFTDSSIHYFVWDI